MASASILSSCRTYSNVSARPTAVPDRSYGGLGLGLSIVRHLVEAQGGTVRAESPGEGGGATFVVSLPAHAFPERHDEDASGAVARPTIAVLPLTADEPSHMLRGVRVLVVDDETDAQELAATTLGHHGATVVSAASADEALDTLGRLEIDALLLNLGMPGVDGFTLIQRIRQSSGATANIPAIALSAHAREEDRRRALASGFQAHLSKPVESGALVNAIAALCKPGGRGPERAGRPPAAPA